MVYYKKEQVNAFICKIFLNQELGCITQSVEWGAYISQDMPVSTKVDRYAQVMGSSPIVTKYFYTNV